MNLTSRTQSNDKDLSNQHGLYVSGLVCGGCWDIILCGALSVKNFNSTAFQGGSVVPGEWMSTCFFHLSQYKSDCCDLEI